VKLFLFNIISLVYGTIEPAVWKLADAAQDEAFWLPVYALLNTLYHLLIIAKLFSD